jgi:hypothetical protein
MPTRRNDYFNNPQMAAIASNLAGLFAPPSAQDFYAMSRTEGQDFQNEATRRAFEAMTAAGVTPDVQDRYGIGMTAFGQGFNPTQSHRAVDIASADRRYGTDVGASVARRGQDIGLAQAYATNNLTGEQAIPGVPPEVAEALGLGFDLPAVSGQSIGAPRAPLTQAQVLGGETQRLIDEGMMTDEMIQAQVFGSTPVETITGPGGRPQIVTRPQALGQAPAAPQGGMGSLSRFIIVDETGEQQVVSGFTTPEGQVVMPDGTDITHMNPIPASNSGGTQFEVGPDGQIRFSMGGDSLTNRTTSDLQRGREMAVQLNRSMTSLYRNLTPEALGAAGQFNDEFVNRVVAQVVPNAANLPVAAQRTQLRAAIVREARGILGNDRLNREDRERIAQLMPDPNTLFESFPRARASLATIATYAAYDAAFADARLGGGELPPLNPQIVGQLVDQGLLEPDIARDAVSMLFGRSGQGAAPTAPNPAAQGGAADPATVLQQAQEAIARGADRNAVIERLLGMGIDPEGL